MAEQPEVERQDIEAALETRRELGLAYEREVVDSFAERIEHAIETRVGARLAHEHRADAIERRQGAQQLALGIVSLVTGIPITAITLSNGPEDGRTMTAVVAWGGIAAVNWAHAWRTRRRR